MAEVEARVAVLRVVVGADSDHLGVVEAELHYLAVVGEIVGADADLDRLVGAEPGIHYLSFHRDHVDHRDVHHRNSADVLRR